MLGALEKYGGVAATRSRHGVIRRVESGGAFTEREMCERLDTAQFRGERRHSGGVVVLQAFAYDRERVLCLSTAHECRRNSSGND